ncbi:MAG: PEP-utilizing enzyme [Chloroflexota bacterium]|nr:PEP-utilizing enzyme [Chloroflexota bacterium]MDH5242344.1 PEP-utilizing enzyme [Chloroflexota bacterium]
MTLRPGARIQASTSEDQPVAATEEILGQFLGDETFPVTWDSEAEQDFFWVYDDLHCPHPVSPMFFDIGGWWLSCDHMFRRFGTPFAVDWLAKNVNGYVYTTAIPADPELRIDATEYSSRYGARVPRDADFAATMGAYLDTVLPVYGRDFADWWRDRLRPEMERNFVFLEERLDTADQMDLADLACLLEDAIDIHDRHWKIHWMLNFAQLSATLNLRAVMERVRGQVDEELLGRLQNSASDRNWDSIEALWRMKNEIRDDDVLRAAFAPEDVDRIAADLRSSERGRRFIAERMEPYQREFGWHAVWSHEFIFPTAREEMEPILELIRGYLTTDYDFPSAIEAMRLDIEAASDELLQGLSGPALEEMRAANAVNLRMAPLTPDHHFYIDQGANAHVRLVLLEVGRKLVELGRLDQRDDVLFLRYNELRGLIGSADAIAAREIVAERRAQREAAALLHPRDWVGTVTPSQLAFPYLVNWGYPDRFYQKQSEDQRVITGIAASPGRIEGIARVVRTVDEFDDVRDGDILVCQMTNPAWVVLFTKISGLVTDTGGTTSHPAVLSREFGIPAVVGTSVATQRISTGDRVMVDGGAGRVEILRDESARPAVEPSAAIGS